MAVGYRLVDRAQSFLLPPDMLDWLPDGHLVWLVIDLVAEVDTSRFHTARVQAGPGRRAYDPDMLLTLLIYGYANGVRSSRRIERLCEVDVAFRVICAQDVPDHATISRFRAEHDTAFEDLFEQVLAVCARAGLGRLGTVSIDGTKIAANASLDRSTDQAGLRRQVRRILDEAAATDAAEDAEHGDARGDELPEDLLDPRSRPGRLRECLDQVKTEQAKTADDPDTPVDPDPAADRPDPEDATDPDDADGAGGEAGGDRPGTDLVDPRSRHGRLLQCLDQLESEQAAAATSTELVIVRENNRVARPTEAQNRAAVRVEAAQNALAKARDRVLTAQQVTATRRAAAHRRGEYYSAPADKPVEDYAQVVRARERLDQARARADALDQARARSAANRVATATRNEATRLAALKRNPTDPDSRIMPTRQGWVQGYNAQLAVSDDHLILAAHLSQSPVDTPLFPTMLTATVNASNLITSAGADASIGIVLADAGYFSEANLTTAGPDRLIATGKAHKLEARAREGPTPAPPQDNPIKIMEHRLSTAEGRRTYRRRGATVEPVNGHIKDVTGLRRFARRGLNACQAELHLAALAVNLHRLHHQTAY